MKAVIFDMDGVLIDSEPLWKIAEIEGFGRVGLDLTHTDCEETVGLRIDEVVKMWHNKVGWEGRSLQEVEEDIVAVLIREIKAQGRALDGVYESLEAIQSKGLKIGLATSSANRILEVVLDKLEIAGFFHSVHSAENESHGKPHPAVFLSAAQKLDIHPTDCLVIEDSLNGVIAAKAARMKVVAVPEKSHQYDERLKLADLIIPSLNHLDLEGLQKFWND
ncbi:hexitol phosphatase HxpB [Paracrocinitomix mangrovi]|uniref:hexitol phosphatase HxpB n=1 Tax=Paracrocinitomix mangrovi TaxID=2862509 RepID=UPI001C8EB806|nr:hexitol phosphatase HxpB [Paracrocinitomix mangrovi]UKN00104.1 hexitol phosphatase HxpB [Paracrocinitomix mangrovi]